MKRPGAHQHNAATAECRTDDTPEKVICINDSNLGPDRPGAAQAVFPSGPVKLGHVYHVTGSGIFDEYGTPAFRLLGCPSLCGLRGTDVGWKQGRFKKVR